MKGGGFGLIGDIVVGIIGAFIGGWLFGVIGIFAGGLVGAVITAFVGACVLLFVIRLIKKAGRRGVFVFARSGLDRAGRRYG
ncbi:MAG: GlsB/YeaQ/YmgE family stress response membrane protein [Thermoanaerobaculales bacterium]|nr:GlsB/YeaQ/YmgE family stress response membrane protein [Thermoanaerobaculales bacterium]